MAIRTSVLGLIAVLLVACQPVDRLELDEEPTPAAVSPRPGTTALPGTLSDLVERGRGPALEWQREPVLAELSVTLHGETWRRARLLYVAADADRVLSLRFDGEQVTQERVTLETLGLQPLPPAATADIPPFPDDALEPAALVEAAAEHAAECLDGPSSEVTYDTGAPAAWDGRVWSAPPTWVATLWHAGEGGGGQARRVDPVTGEALDDTCARVDP